MSGWLAGFGLTALAMGSDPLGVHAQHADGGQGVTAENVFFLFFFMVVSAGSFAIFARPMVSVRPGVLVLRNVFRDVTVPFALITGYDTDSMHLRVLADGRWYRAWGMERANISILTGSAGAAGKAVDRIREYQDERPEGTPDRVSVTIRRPGVGEGVLCALWLAYWTVGLAFGA